MSQELISIFNLDKRLQDLYFNELKSYAYKAALAQEENGKESFEERTYAISVSCAMDFFIQLHAMHEEFFEEDASLDLLFPEKMSLSKPIFKNFFSDENLSSIFHYSLLNEFIKNSILLTLDEHNISCADEKYSDAAINDKANALYFEQVSYRGLFKFCKEQFCGEDLPSVELLAEINYHNNDVIMDFIHEHNLSEKVADVLFNFAVFEFKYLYDNDIYDDDYSSKMEQLLNDLVELGVDPSIISFRDRFVAVKFKDIIQNLSQKFLKANKKYSNAKLLASILDLDKAASNMFALSVMALDKINDMSKNAELTKLKNKHHILDLKVLDCLDQELIYMDFFSSVYDHIYAVGQEFFASDGSPKEILKKRSLFAVFFCSRAFLLVQRSNYEFLKASCKIPNKLSLTKLKSVIKDPINLGFVLSCYDASPADPDVLLLKGGLNSSQLRTCNLFIDNSGYFTPTGLVKGFLGKFNS